VKTPCWRETSSSAAAEIAGSSENTGRQGGGAAACAKVAPTIPSRIGAAAIKTANSRITVALMRVMVVMGPK
jgi:hypothetical protein